MKIVISVIALTVATSSISVAGGHQGNSSSAQAMVEKIQELGADIAPTVSGKNALGKGDSGWGNAGSRLTAGTQVSKSGKK